MFRASDLDALKEEIENFQVPVFLAERSNATEEFRILALNRAHEKASGMLHDTSALMRISDFLPEDQARHVNRKYASAISSGGPLDYREELTLPDGHMTWDTTIRPVETDSGTERILGHAIAVKTKRTDIADLLAFEDVRYFSAEAAFQLSRVTEMLDAVDNGHADLRDLRTSVGFLAGICRSVDSTLSEVRARATQRIEEAKTEEGGYLMSLSSNTPPSMRDTACRLVEMVHAHGQKTGTAA